MPLSIIFSKIIQSNNIELAKQSNLLIKMFEDVLGFEFKCDTIKKENVDSNDDKLMNLISDIREKLRTAKNYEMSDYIRDKLTELNISVSDKKL